MNHILLVYIITRVGGEPYIISIYNYSGRGVNRSGSEVLYFSSSPFQLLPMITHVDYGIVFYLYYCGIWSVCWK